MPQVLGRVIRELVHEKLTTIDEIEEITGRSASTVYRWMNDESEPYFSDVRRLIRNMKRPEARRAMLQRLAADLPLTIEWADDDADDLLGDVEDGRAGHEVLDRALLALDCVTHALSEGNEAIREQRLTANAYDSIQARLSEAIRYLSACRKMLERYRPDSGD